MFLSQACATSSKGGPVVPSGAGTAGTTWTIATPDGPVVVSEFPQFDDSAMCGWDCRFVGDKDNSYSFLLALLSSLGSVQLVLDWKPSELSKRIESGLGEQLGAVECAQEQIGALAESSIPLFREASSRIVQSATELTARMRVSASEIAKSKSQKSTDQIAASQTKVRAGISARLSGLLERLPIQIEASAVSCKSETRRVCIAEEDAANLSCLRLDRFCDSQLVDSFGVDSSAPLSSALCKFVRRLDQGKKPAPMAGTK